MKMATHGLLRLILVFCFPQLSLAAVTFSFSLETYQTNCTDTSSRCDVMFTFCFDTPKSAFSIDTCAYKMTNESGDLGDVEFLNFGSDIKGITNPIVFDINSSEVSTVMLVIRQNLTLSKPHLLTTSQNITFEVYSNVSTAEYVNGSLSYSGYTFGYKYRAYCKENFYGSTCAANCVPQNTSQGHFTCDEEGRRICLSGCYPPDGGTSTQKKDSGFLWWPIVLGFFVFCIAVIIVVFFELSRRMMKEKSRPPSSIEVDHFQPNRLSIENSRYYLHRDKPGGTSSNPDTRTAMQLPRSADCNADVMVITHHIDDTRAKSEVTPVLVRQGRPGMNGNAHVYDKTGQVALDTGHHYGDFEDLNHKVGGEDYMLPNMGSFKPSPEEERKNTSDVKPVMLEGGHNMGSFKPSPEEERKNTSDEKPVMLEGDLGDEPVQGLINPVYESEEQDLHEPFQGIKAPETVQAAASSEGEEDHLALSPAWEDEDDGKHRPVQGFSSPVFDSEEQDLPEPFQSTKAPETVQAAAGHVGEEDYLARSPAWGDEDDGKNRSSSPPTLPEKPKENPEPAMKPYSHLKEDDDDNKDDDIKHQKQDSNSDEGDDQSSGSVKDPYLRLEAETSEAEKFDSDDDDDDDGDDDEDKDDDSKHHKQDSNSDEGEGDDQSSGSVKDPYLRLEAETSETEKFDSDDDDDDDDDDKDDEDKDDYSKHQKQDSNSDEGEGDDQSSGSVKDQDLRLKGETSEAEKFDSDDDDDDDVDKDDEDKNDDSKHKKQDSSSDEGEGDDQSSGSVKDPYLRLEAETSEAEKFDSDDDDDDYDDELKFVGSYSKDKIGEDRFDMDLPGETATDDIDSRANPDNERQYPLHQMARDTTPKPAYF